MRKHDRVYCRAAIVLTQIERAMLLLEVRAGFGDGCAATETPQVLNQGGREKHREQKRFPAVASLPDVARATAPLKFHAYSTCTRGGFFREQKPDPRRTCARCFCYFERLKTALAR